MRQSKKNDFLKEIKQYLDDYLKQDTKIFMFNFIERKIDVLYHNQTWMVVKFDNLNKWIKENKKKGGE